MKIYFSSFFPCVRKCLVAAHELDLRFPDLGGRHRFPGVAAGYAGFSQRPSMASTWALPA